ncbi:tetratricopeptide repeat protein [Flammeovirga sp. SJP92]|uniref:tetratricopeptide repeat protein n=1 Tax=Flammeovirga sp. SJP92 TaxID=1775430 RepID=UPI001560CBB3|nr:tetratricopeptide repeat protein [Flammeovirga sp. SJP92]
MRFFILLILNVVTTSILHGQTLTEKIAKNACEYLDSIDKNSINEDSIQSSVAIAMAKVLSEDSLTSDEKEYLGTMEGIKGTLEETYNLLPSDCYKVRWYVLESKKSIFYKSSDNQSANDCFEKGNEFLKSGNYNKALKQFKTAVKKDNNFIYAIDHLAISYRRKGNFKSAIKYYKRSLEIFPEGDLALLNIAVCYSLTQDYENSIDSYSQLKYLYPDNPEGYFGLSKMLFLRGDYENALDNIFIAHRIYVEMNSNYAKDSEQIMGLMFSELKKLNKSDLIEKKAKEHNIEVQVQK